jgi:hypothetical protein
VSDNYGKGGYSAEKFEDTVGVDRAKGVPVMRYAAEVAAGRATGIHENLRPNKLNKAGVNIRESRDSAAHPISRRIAIGLDVTGSMQKIPEKMLLKIPMVMKLLIEKGYVEGPQLLFGGIDDVKYVHERGLQIGQFEADNRIEESLRDVDLVGCGGGNKHESYDLFLWYMANHSVGDDWEKRGDKGYLFLIGDELVQPTVLRSEVKAFIGVDIEADVPIADVLEKLNEQWEVLYIMPGGTHYFNDERMCDSLKSLFGERFIKLEDPDAVAETIVTAIGVCEGYDVHSIAGSLSSAGACSKSVAAASTALAEFKGGGSLIKKEAVVTGELATSGGAKSGRI